jgi:hypothetical protein
MGVLPFETNALSYLRLGAMADQSDTALLSGREPKKKAQKHEFGLLACCDVIATCVKYYHLTCRRSGALA